MQEQLASLCVACDLSLELGAVGRDFRDFAFRFPRMRHTLFEKGWHGPSKIINNQMAKALLILSLRACLLLAPGWIKNKYSNI